MVKLISFSEVPQLILKTAPFLHSTEIRKSMLTIPHLLPMKDRLLVMYLRAVDLQETVRLKALL